VLLHYGLQMQLRAWYFNLLLLALAAMFVASVGYVATARTAIMVCTVLLLVFGMRHFGWKGIVGALLVLSFGGCLLWSSSDYFRSQILGTIEGVGGASTSYISISTGQRLEIWSKSAKMIMKAPMIGHGT